MIYVAAFLFGAGVAVLLWVIGQFVKDWRALDQDKGE